jgi:hypothetical protein
LKGNLFSVSSGSAKQARICKKVKKNLAIPAINAALSFSTGGSLEEPLARILAKAPPVRRLAKPGARCLHAQPSRTAMLDLVAPASRNENKPPAKATCQRARRGGWLIPAENLFRRLLNLEGSAVEERHKALGLRSSRAKDDGPLKPQVVFPSNTNNSGSKLPHQPSRNTSHRVSKPDRPAPASPSMTEVPS